MAEKPFGLRQGSPHFPELENKHLSQFGHQTFFVEVDVGIEFEDLLNPQTWGPQKRLKRGDKIIVMRVDNAFYAELFCESSSTGIPFLRAVAVVRREIGRVVDGRPTVTHIPTLGGFGVVAGGIVVGNIHPTAAAAQAALDALLAEEPA